MYDIHEVIETLPTLFRKSVITSMGFVTLLIGQIFINLTMRNAPTADYRTVQLWFFILLFVIFIPSMIIREYYRDQNNSINSKLDLILKLLNENDRT